LHIFFLGEDVLLYDSKRVSVYSLQPVLRAACIENDNFSTHSLTIPIEAARQYLYKSTMEVKISPEITLNAVNIEIVTSKIDKKYADEQGGTGERNYLCNLCTSLKEEIRDITDISQGFELNRICEEGKLVSEFRRVNIDKMTQEKLKEKQRLEICPNSFF